ncbi:MAG: polymer-forming cytoskeletal protein [Thiotrichaceae bacterium]|nr:polymer-forming cytoskeletal protein [Thiotrichaceae bacterium]
MFKKNTTVQTVAEQPINHSAPEEKISINTLIGKGTKVEGGISFTGVLRVDGSVHGDISSTDDQAILILESSGQIEGEVRVPHMKVNGTVTGNVYAQGKIDLFPNAQIIGDVFYNLLEMEVGAVVNGRMMREEVASAVAKTEPSPDFEEIVDDLENGEKMEKF